MKKQLSTSMTFMYKFVYPVFFIGILGFAAIMTGLEGRGEDLIFFIAFGFVFLLIYNLFARVKKVHIDDQFLYISNFRKDIKVPIEDINQVSEIKLINPRLISIHFKRETEFGKKIVFLGYYKIFLFFASHPAAEEIRSRI